MTKPLVIYHDNCADGFGAAFAAWMKLGDEAEYLPAQYGLTFDFEHDYFESGVREGDPADFVTGRELYILDFSFPREVMERLFEVCKRVVWLDHHKTAFEMWCEDGERIRCEQSNGRDEVLLDNSKSGALLAWEYFHPGTEVPMLIRHIDDRDRWQFKLEGSKELHAALMSYKPWSFEQWRKFPPRLYIMLEEGTAILRAQDAVVKSLAAKAQKIVITQHCGDPYDERNSLEVEGLAANSPLYQSEIGHKLANASGTFGLVWFWEAKERKVVCSLRSNGDYDVSAIAKAFGGGGHKNAAGFQTDVQTLMGWLK